MYDGAGDQMSSGTFSQDSDFIQNGAYGQANNQDKSPMASLSPDDLIQVCCMLHAA